MSVPALEEAARFVLARFSAAPLSLQPLGNRGGFSGARLWRCDGLLQPLCLRAWPVGDLFSQRLEWIHSLMTTALREGLPVVPAVLPTLSGPTWIEHAGRLWDVTRWLPGKADFHTAPTPGRLREACSALAQVHKRWERLSPKHGPCPAIKRRLDAVLVWRKLLDQGWRPRFRGVLASGVDSWAERAWRLLPAWMDRLPVLLEPWCSRPLLLQPCLCDVWHDHLLFEGDSLTGLVDYGSARLDHVAVDLARMLGSLVGDDRDGWEAGLLAYREVRPLSGDEQELAQVLDRSGIVIGTANWLRWLYHDGRSFEDLTAVRGRLAALVERMERWDQDGRSRLLLISS